MTVSSRSMAAWWMVGFEDRPERSGEICVFEVFGDTVEPGRSAAVGMGLHPFRDPRITDDFAAVPLPLDVTRPRNGTRQRRRSREASSAAVRSGMR